ncbi:hypothetical protein CapIbe_011538 [Capra ibex]
MVAWYAPAGMGPAGCKTVFPDGPECKESIYNAGGPGLISGSGRASGEGNGNPLQYSRLENSMDRGDWISVPDQRLSQGNESPEC